MTSASLTDIAIQDNLDKGTDTLDTTNIPDTLSTPLGTENIPPVPVTAKSIADDEAPSEVMTNPPPKKIPAWVYVSIASAAVMSVVYWFKNFA